jgi:hypothetical protein
MYTQLRNRFRILIIVILVLILSTAAYGFAASNTITDAGKAGEGSNTVSGYDVTNVSYTLDATDPNALDSVDFTLDASATSVYAGIDTNPSTTIQWRSCSNTAGNDFTCDLSTVTISVTNAATLHVAAGQ